MAQASQDSITDKAPVIQVNNLSVAFPGCDALRGVDLKVPAGTVFALLGENGRRQDDADSRVDRISDAHGG